MTLLTFACGLVHIVSVGVCAWQSCKQLLWCNEKRINCETGENNSKITFSMHAMLSFWCMHVLLDILKTFRMIGFVSNLIQTVSFLFSLSVIIIYLYLSENHMACNFFVCNER